MSVDEKAAMLVKYVKEYAIPCTDFEIVEAMSESYDHMGATIADAMLQAGVNYKHVVWPRVRRLLENHPEARTTSGFLKLLTEVGPNNLLGWKGAEKPRRVLCVTRFFCRKGIETEADLRQWLEDSGNLETLKKLRGVGDKTADYFKILVGIQVSAPDRHLCNFLSEASITVDDYDETQQVIDKAADLMKVKRRRFDHSIWKYMSTRKTKSCAN
jgi:hypothetical protein